jgi:hypothetical protein
MGLTIPSQRRRTLSGIRWRASLFGVRTCGGFQLESRLAEPTASSSRLGDDVFGHLRRLLRRARTRSSGRARIQTGEPQLLSFLRARWTFSSTASGQDVPGQKSDDDDRGRDCDDGDGGGGYDHTAILASCPAAKPRR